MKYILTNEDRKLIGLEPLNPKWDLVKFSKETYLYFEKDIIKRKISLGDNYYCEHQMNAQTKDREYLLPKTKRGKLKKLTNTSLSSRKPYGVFFYFANKEIEIGNFTTHKSFYSTPLSESIEDFDQLRIWLDNFKNTITPTELKEIETFRTEKRQRVKIKEGDFFVYKLGRKFTFGRVLLDVIKLRKDETFKQKNHYGINHLMTKPFLIKIYHIITDTKTMDINELKALKALPSRYTMDDDLYYGQFEIIGNLPLESDELDFPISCYRGIGRNNGDVTYLQHGLAYSERKKEETNVKYIDGTYRNEAISRLNVHPLVLEKCIAENSNMPYWNSTHFYFIKNDLRNPKNDAIRNEIFDFFNLKYNSK